MRFFILWSSIAMTLLGATLLSPRDRASAGAGASDDIVPLSATVDVGTRFGVQHVQLTGWMEVAVSASRVEAGREVRDLAVTELNLIGASQLGRLEVTLQPDDARASRGELRALQAGAPFPASSFFDLYVQVSAPESPLGALVFHNNDLLRLLPWAGQNETSISQWPPLGARYRLLPVFGVDNDGDGLIDEDSSDDDNCELRTPPEPGCHDGDGYFDEDRAGPDPATPGVFGDWGDDADCDTFDGEDPPIDLCTPAVCDNDGDGRIDEDPSCVPLFNEVQTSLKLGLCVQDLNLNVAPHVASFSVGRAGPLGMHPADVLGLAPSNAQASAQFPFVRIACASLGLTASGCDDGSDGTQDNIAGLSYGQDFGGSMAQALFSVAPGALGEAGTAVRAQHDCPPADPGFAPEAGGDVFVSSAGGSNALVFDGNGPIGTCPVAFPLGLIEAATARDDLDALDSHDASVIDANRDGVPERPVYFTLDADSPSLTQLAFTAGDVLASAGGSAPSVYATAAQLGLIPGDEITALCLKENGDGAFHASDDVIYFALTPRSPSLAVVGAGPGDILSPGTPLNIVARGTSLGLAGTDALDALSCEQVLLPAGVTGDVNCDGSVNEIDAALVLQYDAHLIPAVPCAANADVNEDGAINSIDALLIMQLNAGLIDRLPQ